MGRLICDNISEIIADITSDYEKGRPIDKQDIFAQPDRYAVRAIIDKLNRIVYAGYYVDRSYKIYNLSTSVAALTEDVAYNMVQIYCGNGKGKTTAAAPAFLCFLYSF